MKNVLITLLMLVSFVSFGQNEFYELRTYEIKFGSPASGLHEYLENALLPALNRQGVKNVGVFGEWGKSDPPKVYVLIPYKNISAYEKAQENIKKDKEFAKAAAKYNQIPVEKAPYSRYSTSMFTAFDGIPQLVKPASGSNLFELRTYEGYIEDAFNRKVKMFNEGELDIFKDTDLHSVFFGEKIAGPDMPCLTYLLAFKDMEERDANWKKFVDHPEWKRISQLPEYANTVSNITRIFLVPLGYSQL
ncbi:MAG: NIPSNAP family protein [Cyclobacteriaceae bacterium]|nr:NIPSNAP family protein [Cyclobacteriaceae bacterium]